MDDKSTFVDEELKLTEAGLRVNPKSYCSWFHRCWLLDNFGDESNWNRELLICTKYLELDDRNCEYGLNWFINALYAVI